MNKSILVYYKNLMLELHYEEAFIKRLKTCKTEDDCVKLLEHARISSINKELDDTTTYNRYWR